MGGVSKQGGMVLAAGDDTGKSSTIAYQSEQTFIAAAGTILYPRPRMILFPWGYRPLHCHHAWQAVLG